MKPFVLLLFSGCLLNACSLKYQILHGKNYIDKEGMRQGKWAYTMADDNNRSSITSKGSFKNDRPSGMWKYYDKGVLIRKEKYKKRPTGTEIKTKFFYPNRKVEKKGMAWIEYETTDTHYYWLGKWKYYGETGELRAIKLFYKYNPEPDILMEKGE